MTPAWKDESGYSYTVGQRRGEVEPSIWAFDSKHLRVSVHRLIGLDGWYASVRGFLNFKDRRLKSTEIDEAKSEAIRLVEQQTLELLMDVFGDETNDAPIIVNEGATLDTEFDWYNLIEGGYIRPEELLSSGAPDVNDAIEILLRFRTALEEAGVIP